MENLEWPYPLELDKEERITCDVLVLGGGIAGCMAALSAARKGQRVILVEKGAAKMSGAGGSGCDHWESAATNPCSKVTPEDLTNALLDNTDGYNNGISHYIECREGWDRLLDIEKMGGKIRDVDDEFRGAAFRDEKTKLMFAYDYESKFTLRVWGTSFKPAMYNEMKKLGVKIFERIMITSLLTEEGRQGGRCIGATGIHTRTGKFFIFSGKATILCLSRPARIWMFSSDHTGLCEFRPTQCIGDGHAIGWNAGAEFTMMEKSVRTEFSAAGRSYPPYGAGNNHNTWFGASIIDSTGKEIPYADRDGNILQSVEERFIPAKGQSFFLMGGSIDNPKYEYRGPDTLPFSKMLEQGYKLPFYADLTALPETERKVIWGMMVSEEGKTRIPVYENYKNAGFDPEKHVLQCYGIGWTSASFLPQERQLFGLPGGFLNDWELKTNIGGLYAAGDALYASNCYGHAAATGYYAGRHASKYASKTDIIPFDRKQAEREKERIHSPLRNNPEKSIGWKELNMGIAKTMQNYCGELKCDELLNIGLLRLQEYEKNVVPETFAFNPHELVRLLEVFDILTVSQIILHSCIARKTSSAALNFNRSDSNPAEAGEDQKLITVRQVNNSVIIGVKPIDFFGDLKENYEKYNRDYIGGR